MSPVIRISDLIFKRLQKHAQPFVDTTPESVIKKLLDHYENGEVIDSFDGLDDSPSDDNQPLILNPNSPEDLTHTKVLHGNFGDVKIYKWRTLVITAHGYALEKLGSYEELEAISISQIAKGKRIGNGYKYLSDLDISYQGENSNQAWKSALHLAKKFNVEVRMQFMWRHRNTAVHPGKMGLLHWKP